MQKTKKHHTHNYDITGDIEKIKNAFQDTARDFRGKAGDMLNDSVKKAKVRSADAQDTMAQLIAEKPFKAVAAATAVGLLLGYIMHSNRARSRRQR